MTTEPKVNTVDPDELLFEKLIEPKTHTSRAVDGNSAFAKFRDYMVRMLTVAVTKKRHSLSVGSLIQGAVDNGIFNEVSAEQRYRRGYNYFIQSVKALPKGWIVKKVDSKNTLVYTPTK
jgi:hypothetical protein